MRLIDADMLEKELSKRWDISDDQDFCNKEVWDALRNAPTVQADRPHGEWIFRTDIPIGGGRESAGYVCSNCRKDYFRVDGMNFCPNCGAKMKGGDDE